jgi:hypothetical protein
VAAQPALTFAGALRILGSHGPAAIGKLDRALGSVILGAGVVAGAAALGGVTLAPLGVVAATWGWVDQKNEAVTLLRGVVAGLGQRRAKTRDRERGSSESPARTSEHVKLHAGVDTVEG